MKYLPLIPFLLIFSCRGVEYHLNQAKKHLALAGELGAKFKRDTVIKEVIVPGSVSDTTVNWYDTDSIGWIDEGWVTLPDTITIETVKWKTKTKLIRDTVHHTTKVFQRVECKPDTIKVPCDTSLEISAGTTKENFLWGAAGALVGMLLCLLIFALVVKVDPK